MDIFSFFIYCVATPVLIFIVMLMFWIVKKSSQLAKAHDSHVKKEEIRFEYKKREFVGINNRVDNLKNIISEDVVGPIKEVTQRISLYGIEATLENLENAFKDWDIECQKFTKNSLLILTSYDDFKLTIITELDINRELLNFEVFCNAFEGINKEIYEKINKFNNDTIVGHLELKEYSNLYLPIFTYSLMLNENKLNKHNIIKVIQLACSSLIELFRNDLKIELEVVTLMITDYLKLEMGEEKFNEHIKNQSSENQEA